MFNFLVRLKICQREFRKDANAETKANFVMGLIQADANFEKCHVSKKTRDLPVSGGSRGVDVYANLSTRGA